MQQPTEKTDSNEAIGRLELVAATAAGAELQAIEPPADGQQPTETNSSEAIGRLVDDVPASVTGTRELVAATAAGAPELPDAPAHADPIWCLVDDMRGEMRVLAQRVQQLELLQNTGFIDKSTPAKPDSGKAAPGV